MMSDKVMAGMEEGPHEKQVFAVYCKDDKLLRFYKREEVPQAGVEFDGRTADAVYADVLDQGAYSRIRRDHGSDIADIEIVDEGLGSLLLDKEIELRRKTDSEGAHLHLVARAGRYARRALAGIAGRDGFAMPAVGAGRRALPRRSPDKASAALTCMLGLESGPITMRKDGGSLEQRL